MLKRSLLIAAAALLTASLFAVFPVSADNADVPAPAYDGPVISVFPGYVHKVETDGYIFYERNAAAARDVLRYSADLCEFDDYQKQSADVNFDGEVDASDARTLLRYSANLCNFGISVKKGQTLTFEPQAGWWTLESVTQSSDYLRIEKLQEEQCSPDPAPGDIGRQMLLVTPQTAGTFPFVAQVRGFSGEVEQSARFEIFCDGATDRSMTISRVSYTNDERIYKNSLNADAAGYATGHFPVYVFDTAEQFADFKADCAGYIGLSLDPSPYSREVSFNRQTSPYGEDFFSANSLILVYVPTSSGSYRVGCESLNTENGSFCMNVEIIRPEGAHTCDMNGWFITLEMTDADAAGFGSFDAVTGSAD